MSQLQLFGIQTRAIGSEQSGDKELQLKTALFDGDGIEDAQAYMVTDPAPTIYALVFMPYMYELINLTYPSGVMPYSEILRMYNLTDGWQTVNMTGNLLQNISYEWVETTLPDSYVLWSIVQYNNSQGLRGYPIGNLRTGLDWNASI